MNSSVSSRSRAAAIASGGGRGAQPLGVDDRVVGELDPLPAAVAVHRVVAAADRADPPGVAQPALELGDVAGAEVGSVSRPSVNACTTTSGTPSCAASSISASRWVQPECTPPSETRPDQVQPPAGARRAAAQAASSASFSKKRAVGDRVVDPGQVLLDDRAGAEVEVADLGVAHLPVGQADVAAARPRASCADSAPRARRRPGCRPARSALPGPGLGEPPAVEDDQRDRAAPGARRRRLGHRGSRGRLADRDEVVEVERGAADQAAVDVVRGANSSAAFAGFTEPP